MIHDVCVEFFSIYFCFPSFLILSLLLLFFLMSMHHHLLNCPTITIINFPNYFQAQTMVIFLMAIQVISPLPSLFKELVDFLLFLEQKCLYIHFKNYLQPVAKGQPSSLIFQNFINNFL